MTTAVMSKTELIESKIDRGTAGALSVKRESGGMVFCNMGEVMEFAKLMAVSGQAVPPHCRNQVGVCLALVIQSIEWRMSPYAVANKSYVVNDRVSYESQLIHAVIEQRAPIVSRLRHSFSGSGVTRKCKVWATMQGETDPLVYESPEFQTITPKNSPLWKSKPDLQLYYNTSRDWARAYFPDVILGVYAEDELDTVTVNSGFRRPAPTSLEDLTERLNGEGSAAGDNGNGAGRDDQPAQEREPGDESSDDQGELPSLSTLADELAAATMIGEVNAIEKKHLDALTEERDHIEVGIACADKRNEIKAKRGTGSKEQSPAST